VIVCVVLVAPIGGSGSDVWAARRTAVSCPDYLVIDSRGSGEDLGTVSPPGSAFFQEFRARVPIPNQAIKIWTNPYPAAGDKFTLVGAALKVPHLGAYHDSVVAGKKLLAAKIAEEARACPLTQMLLVGYSQGAQVTADVYQNGSQRGVIGVALFGDPYFNSADSAVDQGSFQPGRNGALGTRSLYRASMFVRSYCHKNDPVCQGPRDASDAPLLRPSQHENYPPDARTAADYFAQVASVVGTSASFSNDEGTNTNGVGVLDLAICPKSDLVPIGRSWACQKDWSGTPVAAPAAVFCTARYANEVGHSWATSIGYSSWTSGWGSGGTIGGLTGGPAEQIAAGLLREPSGPLWPGKVVCSFSLDGAVVAQTSITVTS
jgi:predicted esterase